MVRSIAPTDLPKTAAEEGQEQQWVGVEDQLMLVDC